MKKISGIQKINLPLEQVNPVYNFLRQAGDKGVEGVALWVGNFISEIEFEIKTTIIPAQKAYNIEGGLLYSVGEEELHRINVWLYENNMTLISQIHSHPGRAYHSETDDAYPIVATVGGISIVVPDFAIKSFAVQDWAVYRLSYDNIWVEQTKHQVQSLINIIT
jgi:hypothetical protein